MPVLFVNIPTWLIKDEDSELHQITAKVYETWIVIHRASSSALNNCKRGDNGCPKG